MSQLCLARMGRFAGAVRFPGLHRVTSVDCMSRLGDVTSKRKVRCHKRRKYSCGNLWRTPNFLDFMRPLRWPSQKRAGSFSPEWGRFGPPRSEWKRGAAHYSAHGVSSLFRKRVAESWRVELLIGQRLSARAGQFFGLHGRLARSRARGRRCRVCRNRSSGRVASSADAGGSERRRSDFGRCRLRARRRGSR